MEIEPYSHPLFLCVSLMGQEHSNICHDWTWLEKQLCWATFFKKWGSWGWHLFLNRVSSINGKGYLDFKGLLFTVVVGSTYFTWPPPHFLRMARSFFWRTHLHSFNCVVLMALLIIIPSSQLPSPTLWSDCVRRWGLSEVIKSWGQRTSWQWEKACFLSLSLSTLWGHSTKVAIWKLETGLSPEPDHAGTVISQFPDPHGEKCLLRKPPSLCYSVTAIPAD